MPEPETPEEIPPAEITGARERPMGFLDHLEELRRTLFHCTVALLVGMTLAGFFLDRTVHWLRWPFEVVMQRRQLPDKLGTLGIMDSMSIALQAILIAGLSLALPFILYFVGRFVSPALHARERRVAVPFLAAAVLLFLAGVAFAFFILMPGAVDVSVELNQYLGLQMSWTAESYFELLTWMILAMGLSFQFPLLILILERFGVVEIETMRGARRFVILGLLIFAAVITPTGDPVTMTAVAAPLYLLFEAALLVAAFSRRRRRRTEGA